MPMTKAERERVATLEQQLREARALRWVPAVEADVQPAARGKPHNPGWMVNSWPGHERIGPHDPERVGARLPYYSTRLLALRALRHAVTVQCAARLAGIDAMIEAEEAEEAGNG